MSPRKTRVELASLRTTVAYSTRCHEVPCYSRATRARVLRCVPVLPMVPSQGIDKEGSAAPIETKAVHAGLDRPID